MYGTDLTPQQASRLLHRADRDRDHYERLLARMRAVEFPPTDPLYVHVRAVVITLRAMVLQAGEGLPKGEYRRLQRRAQCWPPV